ncbi:MAG: methyltransferase domain-containing protein [Synechococcaceae cyanobacterium MAG-AL2]|uniref:methyltransferase domain-containing protein n=1 Tax=Candidatus Regnicoccus frigidus TaxID=3074015 RepID=UPI00281A71F0|nr:methyltransferase domain-containing protein [Candidatus Regnicoccus frigidus]MCT4368474.1 methyltransferase domain-containing protein [Candidatus Regnicoccus frigidus MAG-AL2]
MAHEQQTKFIALCVENIPGAAESSRVLEVGSWAGCGGGYRYLFPNATYIGIDVSQGPGVDHVCPGQDAEFPTNSFDVVISTECFEHNQFWRETLANMIRMCRPGGTLLVTCAGLARPEHGTSRTSISGSLTATALGDDYYSNLSPSDFVKTGLLGSLATYTFSENRESCDLYFAGITLSPEGLPDSIQEILTQISREAAMSQPKAKGSFFSNGLSLLRYRTLQLVAVNLGEQRYHNLRLHHQKSGLSLRQPLTLLKLFRNLRNNKDKQQTEAIEVDQKRP